MPLEPRLMYDGAAAAAAGAAVAHHAHAHHHDHAEHASGSTLPQAAIAAPAAEAPPHSHHEEATQLVFIDGSVPDYQILEQGVQPGVRVVILNSDSDGMQQIADYLQQHHFHNLDAISIVGHGTADELALGNDRLTAADAPSYAAQLAIVGKALKPGGDLLLYGCDVAQGDNDPLLAEVASETGGATVAAASHLIGAAAEGGSWTLDIATGAVAAATPFTTAALQAYPDLLTIPSSLLWYTANDGASSSGTGVFHTDAGGTTKETGTITGVATDASSDVIGDPAGIAVDPADGYYFVVDQNAGPSHDLYEILRGQIGSSAAPTVIYESGAGTAGLGPGSDPLFGLAYDPANGTLYFSQEDPNDGSGLTTTDTGIYALHNANAASVASIGFATQLVNLNSGTQQVNEIALDVTHNLLFFTDGLGGLTSVDNLEVANLTTGSVLNSDLATAPSSATMSGVTVDPTTDRILWTTTDSGTNTNNTIHSATYIIGSSVTLSGATQLYSGSSALSTGQSPLDIAIDGTTFYVLTSATDGSADTAKILEGNLNGSGPLSVVDTPINTGSAADAYALTLEAQPTVVASGTVSAVAASSPIAVKLDSSATVSNANGFDLAGATVSIETGFTSGDTLSFDNGAGSETFVDGDTITVKSNVNGVLTLQGVASAADYQAALDSVAFSTTSTSTTDVSRTIDWTVTDGVVGSGTATSSVTVHVPPAPGTVSVSTSIGGVTPATLTATFRDANPGASASEFSGTINWGDGETTAFTSADVSGSNGAFTVSGSHLYAQEGTYPTTVTIDDSGGGTASESGTAAVEHAPPTLTAGGTATYIAGGAATTLDGSLSVSDIDSNGMLSGATVSISSGLLAGDMLAANTTGTSISASYNSSTGTLTLTGADTLADYQQVLDSITYSSTSQDPTGAGTETSRTITWAVNDGVASSSATSTLDVHTPPVVSNTGNTVTYTQGDSYTTLDARITITDVDSPLIQSATAAITGGFQAGDMLQWNGINVTGGYAVGFSDFHTVVLNYDPSTGVCTMTGAATTADYAVILGGIDFTSSSGDPTAGGTDFSRTITWTVNDGTATSAPVTSRVTVTAAPVIANAGNSVSYTEGGAATAVDSGLTLTDFSSPTLASATVSISSGLLAGDTLAANTTGTSISASYNSSTGTLTLTGADTLADYQQVLDSITYSSTSQDPTNILGGGTDTSRTITWQLNDGTNRSAVASSTVNVTPVNQPPVVSNAGNTVTYTQGGSYTNLDAAITIADVDSPLIQSATAAIAGGFQAGDMLRWNGINVTGGYAVGFSDFHTVVLNYDPSTGVCTMNGAATAAEYAVILGGIDFTSSSGNPSDYGTDLSRTITWTVNDGASANNLSSPTITTVTIVPVDQAPALGNAGTGSTYLAGGAAATLDPAISVSDVDNQTLASATVAISSGYLAGDTLSFDGGSSSESFLDGGSITANYNARTLVLTGNAETSVADFQQALQSVTFSSSAGDPTNAGADTSRTITWTANDGMLSSGAVTTTLAVYSPPAVSAGATATFTGGGGAVVLDGGLSLNDLESTTLSSATVSISGFVSGDTLNFTTRNGITGSYDAADGVLTLSGLSSVANYQTALDSITYSFSPANGDPTGGAADATSRTISWVVNDGITTNSPATSTLETVHVAPTLTAGGTATFDGGGSPVALDAGLTLSDVDSGGMLTGAAVIIGPELVTGDTLNFVDQNGITGSYDAVHGVLRLSGRASIADYQAALQSVTYSFSPADGDPTNGGADMSRSVFWIITDGSTSNGTASATTTLDTAHVAPSLTASGTVTFTGGGSPVALDGSLTLSDVDSGGMLTGAAVIIGPELVTGDTLNFVDQNGITGSYDAVHGVLRLTGDASVADYQAALRSITYSFSPTNGDPTDGGADTSRSISWIVTDGSTSNGTASATTTLDTVHVAPSLTASGTVTFDGGGSPVVLDAGLTLSDVDSGGMLTGAAVIIGPELVTGDTLNFVDQNGITGSYDAVHGVLRLSGTASIADYQAALQSVTYSFSPADGDSTNGGADTSRSISWIVTDGSTSNGTASATSTLDTVHVAPTVTASGSVTFAGGDGPVVLDSGLTLTDVDSGGMLTGATVTIAAPIAGDALSFNGTSNSETFSDGATITAAFANGTLTLSGTASVADYQAALQSVEYREVQADGDPTGGGARSSSSVEWVVTDGSSSNGTSNTGQSTLDTVHTAPSLSAGGLATFSSGSSPTPVALDGGLTLSDVDSGGTIASATVSIGTGFTSGDSLSVDGVTGGLVGTTNISASYSNGVLTLTGIDTVANYQSVLREVEYSFTGDPSNGGTDPGRIITWTVNDGSTSHGTASATSTLTTNGPPPVVAGTAGETAEFVQQQGAPVVLDSAITLSDSDSATLSDARVSLSGVVSGDTLAADTAGTGISASYSNGVLTLTGIDMVADYQKVLRSVTYFSSAADPTGADATRTVTVDWQVDDGKTTNDLSNVGASTLDIHVLPVVTAGADVTYTPGGGPAAADPSLTVADHDSNPILSATVSITSGLAAGDTLTMAGTNLDLFGDGAGLTASYSNGTLVITEVAGLNPASTADFQAALQSVTFSNTSANPDNLGQDPSRTLTWTVNTGLNGQTSAPVTSTIELPHTPPSVSAGGVADYLSNGPATLDGSLTLSDPDSGGNLTGATVSIGSGFTAGDTLNFTDQSDITGSYDAVHGILTLSGTASIAQYQAALRSITYSFTGASGDATGGGADPSRTIDWVVQDASLTNNTSNAASSTLGVLNLAAGGTQTFTGGGSAVTLDSALAISGTDFNALMTATVTIGNYISGDTLNYTNTSAQLEGNIEVQSDSNGVLVLSSAGGTATEAQWQNALEHVTYSFSPVNGDPTASGGRTSTTIDWLVSDGNGASNTATSTLDIAHVAPTVTAGGTVTFTGGGGPVTLDGTLTVGDVDSGGTLAGATVSIANGFTAGDTLNFTSQNGITGSYDAVHGILTLSGTATIAQYQAALESITYSFAPANGDPTAGGGDTARSIAWVVSDGSSSNGSSAPEASGIAVQHVSPVISTNGFAGVDSFGLAVPLDPIVTVRDGDSPTLSSVIIAISSGHIAGDVLSLNHGAASQSFGDGGSIAARYDAASGVLTLTGTASLADYQQALRSVTFEAEVNLTSARSFTWSVNDGAGAAGQSAASQSGMLVIGVPTTRPQPQPPLSPLPPSGLPGVATFTLTPLPPIPAPPGLVIGALPVFGGPATLTSIAPAAGPDATFVALYHGIGNVEFSGDRSFEFAVPHDAFIASADDIGLGFTATLADGTPLPPWLHFDAATGRFTGTPPSDASGDYTIAVILHDAAGHEAIATFHLTIEQDQAAIEAAPSPAQAAITPRDPGLPARGHLRLAADNEHRPDATAPHRPGFASGADHGASGQHSAGERAEAAPAGKPGLSAQLKAAGRAGFLSERQALIDSARQRAAG